MSIISKPSLTNYAGYECMKTKCNNRRNFRKLKCSSKFHKIHAVLQNATRLIVLGFDNRQPLQVILCRLPENGRKETVKEMKERSGKEEERK